MDDLIIKGPKRIHPTPPKGFGEYFFERATELGDKICQIDGNTEETETYAQVKSRTIKVALGMKELGFKQNETVLLCCKSSLNNMIPVLATLYLGGYVSSADPKQSPSDINHLIGLVLPKIIFVDQESIKLIQTSIVGLDLEPIFIVIGDSEKYTTLKSLEKTYDDEEKFCPVSQKLTDTAFIMFSSGTTSSPKGIKVSNKYALDTGIMTWETGNIKPGVLLHLSSFYWISALVVTSTAFRTGSAKVIGNNISAERFLYLTEKYKISFTFMVNYYTHGIISLGKEVIDKYDTSSLYSILLAGSPGHPEQTLKLRELLPHTRISMAYGATETNSITCFNYKDEEAYQNKIESSGTLVSGVELKVVDLKTGQLLGPNQEGEIRIKSSSWMSGYHNLVKNDTFDEDGFIKLGDLGYYDQDHYIYVTGRIQETFKYQAMQIVPSSVENVLLTHPAVAEAIVFGVKHQVDDNHAGALVVLKPNCQVDVKELLDFTNERVSNYHKLRAGILIVNNIPKTPSGKVQRRSVIEMFSKI